MKWVSFRNLLRQLTRSPLHRVPYAATLQFKRNSNEPYNKSEERVNDRFFEPMLHLTVIIGLLLATLFLIQMFIVLFEDRMSSDRLKHLATTSNTNGEWRSKKVSSISFHDFCFAVTKWSIFQRIDIHRQVLEKSTDCCSMLTVYTLRKLADRSAHWPRTLLKRQWIQRC